jgi:hypothetical protein
MALSILDGNQSATTLSTILSSGQHITAHTVVSLGTQAITDMRGAVSGSVVSISNLPSTQTIAGTVTANGLTIGGTVSNVFPIGVGTLYSGVQSVADLIGYRLPISLGDSQTVVSASISDPLPTGTNRIGVVTIGGGTVTIGAGTAQIGSVTASISGTVPVSISSVTVGNSITIGSCVTHGVTISNSSVTINGSITANLTYSQTAVSLASTAATAIPIVLPTNGVYGGTLQGYNGTNTYIYSGIQAIGGTSLASATSLPVSLGSLPALVAGTAQIGSVTASISGTVPISISSVTVGNSVTIGSLPALAAGTNQIGSVTASISGTVPISITSVTIGSCVTHGVTIANTVVTFYPAQGTTVSNTNFTSITSSTSLVAADSGREVLTVFNEGPTLYISPGATCTTISYQVRLSAGDYWECPQGQLTLAHTAVFATAGTARVTQVS